ncbi:asparagine synthase (glutamine-hydrolyzing) [Methylophilaceae bacterium]|nr:asparagine synthase (glutamine-hydrolyzing) [Methylophilaceae bacterium]
MCGIGGVVWQGGENRMQIARKTLNSMKHRGPDEAGIYIDEFIGLAHARLSIVDDAGGKQPFCIPNHDEILIYNGEIYNYNQLKRMLTDRGVVLKSHSDTELLFHLILHFGQQILPSINGQFAFCFYDPKEQSLLLARDAFGEKPLFYREENGYLTFASEVKTLVNLKSFTPELCAKQLNSIQRYWSSLPDQSVFQGVSQIPAGYSMKYKNRTFKLSSFLAPLEPLSKVNNQKIDSLISDAVSKRLRSDVPVGLMLSGGLDSAIIGQEMIEANSSNNLQTFSVTFPNAQFDERKYQEIMVNHLKSNHYQIEIDELTMCDKFADAVYAAEMPSPRTAFTAIYALHQEAQKQGIKVLLSGEGADEMFMGYDIFTEVFIKNQILAGKSFEELQEYISAVNVFMPNDENYHRLARLKFSNYRALAQNKDWNASHSQRHQLGARSLSYSSQNKNNDHLVDEEWYEFLKLKYNNFQNENEFRRAQKIEAETLLSGHLLCTQGDRISMANSVETRMPFLDPSIAAFSLGLDEKKDFFSSKSEKEILKNIYMGRLPKTIIDRKKFPFRAPDSQLFLYSHTGRDFVNSYLDEVDELEEIFNSTKIKNFFEACLKDGADSPRDNFAFVFGLSSLVLQREMKRSFLDQNKSSERLSFKETTKTKYGTVFQIKNWVG